MYDFPIDDSQLSNGQISKPQEPIGWLEHSATHSRIAVFKKINWFRRYMIKLCFGCKYISNDR